jgi:hypothetical protein
MQTIAAWLKNGTYEVGVQLYQKHGTNSYLKQRFALGPNDYNKNKLREELQKLLQVTPDPLPVPTEKSKKVATNVPTSQPVIINKAQDTKTYHALIKKRDHTYLELNQLMEQKHYLPEGNELRLCCLSIISKHQTLTEIWAKLDYYEEHERFPDQMPERVKRSPKQELQYLRQTISKANTRLAKPNCRDKEKTEKLITDSKSRLAELLANRNQNELE